VLTSVECCGLSVRLYSIKWQWWDSEGLVTPWCWNHYTIRSLTESERMWSSRQSFTFTTARSVDCIQTCHLYLFARTAPKEDHHRIIAAALRPPDDWRRPVGRPRTIWLWTVSMTFSAWTSAWRKARDRDVWHQVISMATFLHGVCQ